MSYDKVLHQFRKLFSRPIQSLGLNVLFGNFFRKKHRSAGKMLQNSAEKSSAEKVRLRKVRPRKFVAMYGREMLQNSAEKILLYTIGKKIRKFKPSTEASTLWDASLTIDWDRVGTFGRSIGTVHSKRPEQTN